MKRLELAIDSDLGNVSLVAVAVNRVCAHLGLDETNAGHVELCIVEAVTNAIRHAYGGTPGNRVTITLAACGHQLLIEVSETGTPMPLDQRQKLVHDAKPSEVHPTDRRSLPEGGRGLQIIRALMDEVSYKSADGRNQLSMTKWLVASPK